MVLLNTFFLLFDYFHFKKSVNWAILVLKLLMTPFLCSPSNVKLQSVFNSLGTGVASHLIIAITKSRAMQKVVWRDILREKKTFS